MFKFFLKLHTVALNPLRLLSSHFHLETIVFFDFRSFQWASDVTESKGFDWLFGLDCACWAWAFSSSSRASSCFPWLLLLYFTFKISFVSSHSIFCIRAISRKSLAEIRFNLQQYEKVFILWNTSNVSMWHFRATATLRWVVSLYWQASADKRFIVVCHLINYINYIRTVCLCHKIESGSWSVCYHFCCDSVGWVCFDCNIGRDILVFPKT